MPGVIQEVLEKCKMQEGLWLSIFLAGLRTLRYISGTYTILSVSLHIEI